MSEKEKTLEGATGGNPEGAQGGNQPPAIVIDEINNENSKKTSEHGGAKKKKKIKPNQGKLPMPSQQAGKLTTAIKHIVALKRAKTAKDIVKNAAAEAEKELRILQEQLANVVPENELQQRFKESWIAKNVMRKEEYLVQLRQILTECKTSDEESASTSSSSSSSSSQAALEEAFLMLEQEQLVRRQELRQRQREEELKEQQERDELQRKLLEVRSRASALSRTSARSVRAGAFARGQTTMNRGGLQLLPQVSHPTTEWLHSAEDQARVNARGQGGSELMQQMLLSQAKIPCFKGDQLDYLWFRQSFEIQVERVTTDPVQRLYRLIQSLEGEPLRLVRGCQLAEDPEEGFRRAKELLNDRYGHPVRQSLAFKSKLMSWPAVKTGADLTNFYVHLQQCRQVKSMSSSSLAELDAASTLLVLASKLPDRLQSSWQTRAVDLERKEQREVNFEDFMEFVHRHETARNHPVFGKLGSDKRDASSTPNKLKAFATGAAADAHSTTETALKTATATRTESASTSGQQNREERPNAFKAPCLFCGHDHVAAKCKTPGISRELKKSKLRGLCFSCLKPGHSARQCKYRLKCDHCGGLHPTTLHEEQTSSIGASSNANASQGSSAAQGGTQETTVKEKSLLTQRGSSYAMATVRVKLWATDKRRTITVMALLDAASSATFISKEVASLLELPTRPISLNLSTMAGETEKQTSTVHGLKVSDLEFNHVLSVGVAYVVEALPDLTDAAVVQEDADGWTHLTDVRDHLPRANEPIQMLIGQSVHGAHTPEEVRRGSDNEPFAVRTKLGWVVQGPLNTCAQEKSVLTKALVNYVDAQPATIEEHLQRLYYHEFQGAFDFSSRGPSQEDRAWLKLVDSSAKKNLGHFWVDLPFRTGMDLRLQDNREQALQRLNGLKRRFATNSKFKDDYVAFVQKMIDAGHVEQVDAGSALAQGRVINYIPHHGVYHPQKRKIRVVFNCASKYRGLSLNDCLLSGPDLTNSIVGVLCRFRQFRVPFVADIEAMFYQVFVPEHQRDCLRFLWWKEGRVDKNEVTTYRMKVHLFGATSSPSVANYALRRSADGAALETKKTVLRNFYVDDCLKSVDTEEEAAKLANDLVTTCKEGGFKLTKFVSSNVSFLRRLDRSQLAKELEEIDLSEDKEDPLGSLQERALGVVWNVKLDRLGFKVRPSEDEAATKRSVLSRISQVYDPLGMAAPVIIVARVIFRDLTKDEHDWDKRLNEEDTHRWKSWLKGLEYLQDASIERWMGSVSTGDRYQLHTFCDASTKAYAAVVYLRRVPRRPLESAHVVFVFGKARVAPPKIVTVPRLELTAAKLAADLSHMVRTELEIEIESMVLWSDSQTVLKYLKNQTKRFHVFVANRVEAILNKTSADDWRYVPTQDNPADEATRGLDARSLDESSWLRGPDFLRGAETEWPKESHATTEVADADPEVRTAAVREWVRYTLGEESEPFIEKLAKRYSTAFEFRRALAVWLRLKNRLRGCESTKGLFQSRELQQAERAGIAWLQREHWSEEMETLRRGGQSVSWLQRLSPKIQSTSNLLLMQTRTGVDLPIVPAGPLAYLLVREAHVAEGHQGRQASAASTRRDYWIMQLSKTVRAVIRQCCSCQRRKAQSKPTQMALLPTMRLTPGPPFHTTGLDFFGPFYVRNAQASRKAYGVIFTCAVSRAIHLELADSLDISSFINALRRFCARRGPVGMIVADQGTNLTGACEALQRETAAAIEAHRNDPSVVAALRKTNVEWHFIPPSASHFGGFYERLIRSVREVLTALMEPRGRILTTDQLTTLLCECESILNNRPLTTVSNDPEDLEALTPNHLLLGRRHGERPLPGDYSDLSRALRSRWKLVQHLVADFWHRWKKEYRILLFRRNKWFEKIKRPFRVNDVVLLKDSTKAVRELGQLGRIVAVYPSMDGEVRVVDVKTSRGVYTRPITKLCLLESASDRN